MAGPEHGTLYRGGKPTVRIARHTECGWFVEYDAEGETPEHDCPLKENAGE